MHVIAGNRGITLPENTCHAGRGAGSSLGAREAQAAWRDHAHQASHHYPRSLSARCGRIGCGRLGNVRRGRACARCPDAGSCRRRDGHSLSLLTSRCTDNGTADPIRGPLTVRLSSAPRAVRYGVTDRRAGSGSGPARGGGPSTPCLRHRCMARTKSRRWKPWAWARSEPAGRCASMANA